MRLRNLLLMLLVSVTLAACDLAQGIFKGGFIIGLLIAVVVIFFLMKLFGRGKS